MRIGLVLVATALVVAAQGVLAAGNPQAGKQKAIACQVCHGVDGRSKNPLYPVLAGQHAKYTVRQLKAYKSGMRKDAVMNEMLQKMTDQDMEDIAAYFQSAK